jgi:hypothetical protein
MDHAAEDTYEDTGKTLDEALHKASEKAKAHRKGWYRVVEWSVRVDDSIHEYKVMLGDG